ncbi:MAG: glycosyltransferase family 4 protein [Candidatus Promineifilaceae bacterium]|nr:glycosyltransferase family 4 protein [Candidatus Promineifilaceae bacterium]
MKILYLSQLVPYPADAGPKIRIYHVLQYLAQAGHEITLVAFRREEDDPEQLDHLYRYCREIHTVLMRRSLLQDLWQVASGIVSGHPFLISRDSVDEMYQTLQEVAVRDSFDAIHADQLWMAQYALAAGRRNGHARLVLDEHNAMYLIPERLASGANPLRRAILNREARNMARYEVETCKQFDNVVWVSAEDRRAVRGQSTKLRGANGSSGPATNGMNNLVIPICVDPQAKAVIQRRPDARRVTFLGGLHWPPNAEGVLWFMEEVWPQVQKQAPDAVLTILGKNPPSAVVRRAQVDAHVEAPGYVEDVTPYLAETVAFIVPLHAGGGMRVKILDAWSWGLPVVSTTIGVEGLWYRDGENVLIADRPGAFAQATLRLLMRPEQAAALGAAGRQTVEAHYDWRRVYRAWDKIYGEA